MMTGWGAEAKDERRGALLDFLTNRFGLST
jgi:hypothetical protein